MITEDYCSFEVAKILKEKGFNESCNSFYILLDNGDYRYTMSDFPYKNSCKYNVPSFARPTHQMAMKWLRDKHNIDIGIEPSVGMSGVKVYVPMISTYKPRTDNTNKLKQYERGLYYKDDRGVFPALKKFHKYEEAVEAALKYCLTKLI